LPAYRHAPEPNRMCEGSTLRVGSAAALASS
jgi:hypothetical protein